MTDPMLPPGTNYCQCQDCERYFKSVSAFDAHQVGVGGDRRCMADGELKAAGYEPDSRGYWRKPRQEASEKAA